VDFQLRSIADRGHGCQGKPGEAGTARKISRQTTDFAANPPRIAIQILAEIAKPLEFHTERLNGMLDT
jgi:hypothetical protein